MWKDLSYKDKSELMSLFLKQGVSSLSDMKRIYDGERDVKVDTRILQLVKDLNTDKYSEEQKKRLVEYLIRASGGMAVPVSKVQPARQGLRSKTDTGETLYDRLLYSKTPVETLISENNDRNTYIDQYGYEVSKNLIDNYDGVLEGYHDEDNYDIIDALFKRVAPHNGTPTDDIGVYKDYINKQYYNRNVRAYTYGESPLSKEVLERVNKYAQARGDNSIVLGASTDNGTPFVINNGKEGINYDGAGHLVQFIQDDDGRVYHRQSDIYDFEPSQYVKNWGKVPYMTDALKAVDSVINPVILYNEWKETTPEFLKSIGEYNSKDIWSGVEEVKSAQNKEKEKKIYPILKGLANTVVEGALRGRGYSKGGRVYSGEDDTDGLLSKIVGKIKGVFSQEEEDNNVVNNNFFDDLRKRNQEKYWRKSQKRVRENDSPTKGLSEWLENDIASRQLNFRDKAKALGRDSQNYFIPYIEEKEVVVPGIGRMSTNMLDSLAVNAEKAGTPIIEGLGLLRETMGGAIPNFSIAGYIKSQEQKNPIKEGESYEDWLIRIKVPEVERAAMNSSFARNFEGIYPEFFVNDHEWYTGGWDNSVYGEQLKNIESPLQHAFTMYNLGIYNSGEKGYKDRVKAEGRRLMSTPVIQKWYKEYEKSKK